ncbi:ImmA/IrrE family metallo-endopeptidase [Candidatus Formimonas warabiya]|uniref:ImmA/IrrE family metallo-endopeptidase n=1 Tax=Formimonas warabiya TaxID=1761012 RepID=A0A3G1KNS6_FORW1|nr:ImmA/IrrE family metallo-endopeptidase [Candidatus Formimonas warabiya]ATW24123.1 ImmA/IrrE family metallo-endopeptidase [Candidatus Formimonas warabiya]
MQNIPLCVRRLVKKYETRDPAKIAQAIGVTIKYKSYSHHTKGYFINTLRNKFIVVNKNLPEFEQRIVLAHELGHAILHSNRGTYMIREYTLFPKGIQENEANKFAAEFLIYDIDKNMIKDMSCDQIAQYFGVPKELVVYKFQK